MSWVVYMLRCADGTLYTGSTNNLKKRVQAHNTGKGAKYTRGRAPVELVYTEEYATRALALHEEANLKKLTRVRKLALVAVWLWNQERH
jgi:putative endonuclease